MMMVTSGVGFTVADTVAEVVAFKQAPAPVTVPDTEYVPLAAVVALGMDGF